MLNGYLNQGFENRVEISQAINSTQDAQIFFDVLGGHFNQATSERKKLEKVFKLMDQIYEDHTEAHFQKMLVSKTMIQLRTFISLKYFKQNQVEGFVKQFLNKWLTKLKGNKEYEELVHTVNEMNLSLEDAKAEFTNYVSEFKQLKSDQQSSPNARNVE